MYRDGRIWIGQGAEGPAELLGEMANRHGLIAGATGTGKTVTMKVLAEGFADMGVPVFVADVKGDLAGLVDPDDGNEHVRARVESLGLEAEGYRPRAYPVSFWDVYQQAGIPVRSTIAELGPLLLSRVLGLNETQAGVLSICFRLADENGWLLLDLADLRAMLAYVGEERAQLQLRYGNVSPASIGAIQRKLLQLEDQGAGDFFSEPSLQLEDFLQLDADGRGRIHVLDCVELYRQPLLYSTILLWMLSELFETLPEQGDGDKPRLVFFFDEAHLLFGDSSGELLERITQVVRLIRSKGVGVYFATQNPRDIPDVVAAQLGNRIQHALRAWTPAEMRAVQAAAESFRANPNFDTLEAITTLETGEALVSCLDASGVPSVVQRCLILPPQSAIGTIDEQRRLRLITADPLYARYAEAIDPESAHEILTARVEEQQNERLEAELAAQEERERAAEEKRELAESRQRERERPPAPRATPRGAGGRPPGEGGGAPPRQGEARGRAREGEEAGLADQDVELRGHGRRPRDRALPGPRHPRHLQEISFNN